MKLYKKKCPICGNYFEYWQYPSTEKERNRITCSKMCQYALISTRHSGRLMHPQPIKEELYTNTSCKYCNITIHHLILIPRVFCSIKCKSLWQKENLVGEDNPNYKDYKKVNNRTKYTHQHHRIRKAIIKERCICESCGTKEKLQINHIDRDYTNNSPENLMLLCIDCHSEWHERRGEYREAQLIRNHPMNH